MTIDNTETRWVYAGDGRTTRFAYTNKIFTPSDLKVYVGGVARESGYSVTNAGVKNQGSVVFDEAPAEGLDVVLVRNAADLQTAKYPGTAAGLESSLDRRTAVSQQQADQIRRSVRRPEQSVETYPILWPDGASDQDRTLMVSRSGLTLGPSASGIEDARRNAAAAQAGAREASRRAAAAETAAVETQARLEAISPFEFHGFRRLADGSLEWTRNSEGTFNAADYVDWVVWPAGVNASLNTQGELEVMT